jgi:hypothetical protein
MQEFFRDTNSILEALYKRTRPIDHPGLKGQDREFFIREFLERFFPRKYIVGSGKILDVKGNTSQQADIIIYNESMPVFDYGSTKYFLHDGVLAHIEVKSFLNSSTLKKALDVTKSIKKLNKRESIASYSDSGSLGFKKSTGEIFSCLFAYEGLLKGQTFKSKVLKYYEDESSINNYVDMICVLDRYSSFIMEVDQKSEDLFFLETGEDGLMYFFLFLFEAIYAKWQSIPSMDSYLDIEKLRHKAI